MTPRNFPPADQCSSEDLDAVADLVVSDPSASYDLAGSREHLEALCRRYQALAQERERWEEMAKLAAHERDVARAGMADRENEIARINNERQGEVLAAEAERDRCTAAMARVELAERIASGALRLIDRADVTARDVALLIEPALALDLIRERRAHARTRAGLETALRRLEEQQQTAAADERLRSAFADACLGVTGQTIEQVNIRLDEELAAHPDVVCMTCRDTHTMQFQDRDVMCTHCPTPCERCRSRTPGAGAGPYCATTPCACGCHGPDYPRPPGPLHHARDQRDHQEDTTP